MSLATFPKTYTAGTKVAVGATFTLVSAYNARKRVTLISADSANTQLVYIGGTSGVTAANGFGELSGATKDSITLQGPCAVYAISASGTQNVRVLEGIA